MNSRVQGTSLLVASLALCGAAIAHAQGDVGPYTWRSGANAAVALDEPARARQLDPFFLDWFLDPPSELDELIAEFEEDIEAYLACRASASHDGEPVRRVPISLEPRGELAAFLEGPTRRRRRTDLNGDAMGRWDFDVTFLHEDAEPEESRWAEFIFDFKGGEDLSFYEASCDVRVYRQCVPDATTLCLLDSRFQVKAEWRDPFDGSLNTANATPLGNDSGEFWFFAPSQQELLVKVLDNCRNSSEGFNRFWVFAASSTSVELTMTVTDTHTGAMKTYSDSLRGPSPAITDTQAFATCP